MTLTNESGVRFAAEAVTADVPVTGENVRNALLTLAGRLRESQPDLALPQLETALDDYGPGAFGEQQAVPGRDAISEWADQAVEAWADSDSESESGTERLVRRDVGLAWLDGDRQTAVAWHDEAILVFYLPAGVRRFEIAYRESDLSRGRRRQMLESWPGPAWDARRAQWHAESAVEWTVYSGDNTKRTNGESRTRRVLRRIRHPFRGGKIGVDHDGQPGFVTATVYQHLGAPRKQQIDKLAARRLKHAARELGPLVDHHPELAELSDGSLTNDIVFVHGTMSTCLASLESLIRQIPSGAPQQRILRFEHNTFPTIADNADELAALLLARLHPDQGTRLVLIGHSRGGLVARMAAQTLWTEGIDPNRIRLATFGTPHEGTPLVNAGDRVISTLASAAAGASPFPDPISWLPRYLIRRKGRLPDGIREMEVRSSFLRALSALRQPFRLLTYGATYDKGPGSQSRGVALLDKHGRNLFIKDRRIMPNDLVVSVDSATSVGLPRGMAEPCGHFGYFEQEEVGQAIKELLLGP